MIDFQYCMLRYIFKRHGTAHFYDINIPNKRKVNYENEDDVERGNETSNVFKKSPRVLLEWFDGRITEKNLANRIVLDLGSGFGGRTIYYARAGKSKLCFGLDIDTRGVEESKKYADFIKQDNVFFAMGKGENLPFASDLFDFVLSFDVLEHVNDVEKVFSDVYRVLKPGGRFCSVFPPYYSATGSHVKRTKFPWLNVFFSTEKIYEVLTKEYGDKYELWCHKGKVLRKGLNGTTLKEYLEYASNSQFIVEYQYFAPLLSKPTEIYKSINSTVKREVLRFIFRAAMFLPFLREFMTHRIVFIFRKPFSQPSSRPRGTYEIIN